MKKPYSDKRWTQPPAYETIGWNKLTKKQEAIAAAWEKQLNKELSKRKTAQQEKPSISDS